MNSKEFYIENFSTFEKKLNGESKSFLHTLRKDALDELKQINYPTLRSEEWKYTDVAPIVKQNFTPNPAAEKDGFSKEEIDKALFNDFEYHKLVFINGNCSAEHSSVLNLPEGVVIGSLREISNSQPQLISNYLSKLSKNINAFSALNAAYMRDGLVVIVPDGTVVAKPIQVLFLTASKENVITVPRNLIIAGKNSQVSVIINYSGLGDKKYFTNAVTEVFIGEEAIVDLYKIQNEKEESYHIEKVEADQKSKSVFNHFNLIFGGSIVRNDVNSRLDGEFIETHYYGLALANQKQHIDNHTFVDHAKPNCMSNEVYKNILDEESRAVFNGKIIVREDAQKTNAYQQNKTILLSKSARIDTKPQLEIFADDVKCSHGATVGHLDEVSEFYIRSRGVPKEIAKSMLIRAFANDVIETIKIDPLKEQINHMIFEHLHRVEIENK